MVARCIFERLGKAGNATAREAFENVDRPLQEGIARWQQVVQFTPDNFSAHEERARLAQQKDELALASENYEAARRLKPDRDPWRGNTRRSSGKCTDATTRTATSCALVSAVNLTARQIAERVAPHGLQPRDALLSGRVR